MKQALLYEKLENGLVHCFLCSHNCRINEGELGFCKVRGNRDGVLFTHTYGKAVVLQIDPVEKKPLYHFLPGSTTFSIAALGCNFRCGFCQNWQISQMTAIKNQQVAEISAQELVNLALNKSCRSMSYTYTEPTIYFEYALDTARIAKCKGIYNIFVTNGYMSKEAILAIQPYLDAVNIDLKFFSDVSYRKFCSGSLKPVLNSIKLMREKEIWVEVTTLVIPEVNDSDDELGKIADFIAGVDKNIPWHVSGFHPGYKFMDYPPTPKVTLARAKEIGKEAGLNYVYIGNMIGCLSDTYCSNCEKLIMQRDGFKVKNNYLVGNSCSYCKAKIPGIFEEKN